MTTNSRACRPAGRTPTTAPPLRSSGRRIAPLLAALTALLLGGCAPAASPSAPAAAPPAASGSAPAASSGAAAPTAPAASAAPAAAPAVRTVHVGVLGTPTDGFFFLAEDLGYFKEVGITTDFVNLSAGKDLVPFMASGQLDVGSGGPSAGLFNAIRREIPLRIVADKSTSRGAGAGQALVVRKDLLDSGEVRGIADLRGRPVGVTGTGGTVEFLLDRALATAGLSVRDVDVQEMGYAEMTAAMANHALDATMTLDPLLGVGEQRGIWTPLLWDDDMYHHHTAALLMYSPLFVEQDPDLGRRFMVAYLRALRLWYDSFITGQRTRDDLIPILIKYTPLKEVETWQRYRPSGVDPNGYLNKQGLADEQEWYIAHGYMTERVDLDTVVDYSFLDYANQQLGRYPE